MTETSPRLARAIEERRKALGLTPTTLAEATGLSLSALKNIRRGEVRRYQERLTNPITAALKWTPDSIDRLLAGGDPVPLDATEVAAEIPTPDDGFPAQLLRRLDEANRTLVQILEALTPLDGGRTHSPAVVERHHRALESALGSDDED